MAARVWFYDSIEIRPPADKEKITTLNEKCAPWSINAAGDEIFLPDCLFEDEVTAQELTEKLQIIVDSLPNHSFIGLVTWSNEDDKLDDGYFVVEDRRARAYVLDCSYRPIEEVVECTEERK